MILEGSEASNKTKILVEKYIQLLTGGISSADILVLCQNPIKKDAFIKNIKNDSRINFFERSNIHTFFGLCYNTIKENFCYLESELGGEKIFCAPNLSGLEVSGFVFKKAIQKANFKDYNSKINLMHQLFKRHSLIVQNGLSKEEISKRSSILKESFASDAEIALQEFCEMTNELRSWDYLRQISVFKFLYETQKHIFENIKYLIVDDADEMTPAVMDFLSFLKPNLKEFYVAYDPLGSSRCGYLSAQKNVRDVIQKIFDESPKILTENKSQNVIDFEKKGKLSVDYSVSSKYLEMLDCVFGKIETLLSYGAKPSDITIVTPNFNEILKFYCDEKFEQLNLKYKFLSGSEKLKEDNFIKNVLTLLKLKFFQTELAPDLYEIKNLFCNFLNLPLNFWRKILKNFEEKNSFFTDDFDNEKGFKKYFILKEFIQKSTPENLMLSQKIAECAKKIFYLSNELFETEKFNFLFKQIVDFENVFTDEILNSKFQTAIITQIENSIISENPPAQEIFSEFEKDTILIGTPQKIIDMGKKSKHLLLLDCTSDLWEKNDLGMLYNSWVMSREWSEENFDYETNIRLTDEKTQRILRKLAILAENIYGFSSIFDNLGNENIEGISVFFITQKKQEKQPAKIFEPREDQKPILEYQKGNLAIAAVPGAGKTTVLLALIIKLLEGGEKPDNIFVLTYMDSAARNFKERIKLSLNNLNELPNISTIHGLCLRIIKENANFVRIGLKEDFEILDDSSRQKLIYTIFAKFNIEKDNYEKWEKAISTYKLGTKKLDKSEIEKQNISIRNFMNFVNYYNSILLKNNRIDYDDMLRYALQILEENEDILKHYQELCKFIIEDEAQDSSFVQQRLLKLLSGKHNNLIRCGDVNQAITSTFANADVEGFKNFIEKNPCVQMQSSQRCAEGVYSLANDFINFSKKIPELKNAFFDIKMKGVGGKNPVSDEAVAFRNFETQIEEKNFLIKEIKGIFRKNSVASIGILVRNNFQVENYISFLQANDICAVTTNENLRNKRIFKIINLILKICENPFANSNCEEAAKLIYPDKKFEIFKTLKQKSFLCEKVDKIKNSNDVQLWWDLTYWCAQGHFAPNELALKIGKFYAETPTELSNAYLLSALITKISSGVKTFKEVITKFEDISKRTNYGGIKFFDEKADTIPIDNGTQTTQKVRIMTIHKSKGDEFDYVFLPEFHEGMLPLKLGNSKAKSENIFIEKIKSLVNDYQEKNSEQIVLEQLAENARLLYVAITRAKFKLTFSCSKNYKNFSTKNGVKKSIFVEEFFKRNSDEKN